MSNTKELASTISEMLVEWSCLEPTLVTVPGGGSSPFDWEAQVFQLKGRLECRADGLEVLKAASKCQRLDGLDFSNEEVTLTWILGEGKTKENWKVEVKKSVATFLTNVLTAGEEKDLHRFVQTLTPLNYYSGGTPGLVQGMKGELEKNPVLIKSINEGKKGTIELLVKDIAEKANKAREERSKE